MSQGYESRTKPERVTSENARYDNFLPFIRQNRGLYLRPNPIGKAQK
jgi:hypothetical protein